MHVTESYILESASPMRDTESRDIRALRERIDLLLPADRLLMELALSGSVSRRRIGELVNQPAGTVSRRLARISARLHDPIVRRLMNPRCSLPPDQRQIGVEHFLTGLSAARLARKHAMPASQVRGMLKFLRGWHRGMNSARDEVYVNR